MAHKPILEYRSPIPEIDRRDAPAFLGIGFPILMVVNLALLVVGLLAAAFSATADGWGSIGALVLDVGLIGGGAMIGLIPSAIYASSRWRRVSVSERNKLRGLIWMSAGAMGCALIALMLVFVLPHGGGC